MKHTVQCRSVCSNEQCAKKRKKGTQNQTYTSDIGNAFDDVPFCGKR